MKRYLILVAIATAGVALPLLMKVTGNEAKPNDTRGRGVPGAAHHKVHENANVARAKPWLSSTPQQSPSRDLSPHQADLAGPALALLEEVERHPAFAGNSEVRELVDLERQKIVSSVRGVKQ